MYDNKLVKPGIFLLTLALLVSFLLVGCRLALGAEPDRSGIQISPLSVEREVLPGDEFFFAVTFFNPLGYPQHVRPKFKDFVIDEGNKIQFLDYSSPRYTISRWADFSKDIIELGPHEESTIEVRIKVPGDAVAGGHSGAFFGEVRGSTPLGSSLDEAEVENPFGVSQRVAAGALIFLSVLGNNLEETAWDAELVDFGIEGKNFGGVFLAPELISFRASLRNEGIFHQNVWGGVEIFDLAGEERIGAFHLREKKALPGRTVSYFESWQAPILIGKCKADLKMLYGRKGEQIVSRSLEFWVVDPKLFLVLTAAAIIFILIFIRTRKNSAGA